MEHAHTSVHYMNILLIRQTASTRSSILFYFVIFLVPFIILALLFSLPPGRVSDLGSHSRLFPPLPITVRASCLAFLTREYSRLFYPSSTRVELCRYSPQLSSFFFCKYSRGPSIRRWCAEAL